MGNLSDLLKNLFQTFNLQKSSLPFIHEAIDVKKYPTLSMQAWQERGGWSTIIDLVSKSFSDRLITGKSVGKQVSNLRSSHANGWILHANELRIEDSDWKHLAYLIHQKVRGIGYTLNLAELRSERRAGRIEMITKYYLKPSLKNRYRSFNNSPKADQLYGNITIQYISRDGNPYEFKFLTNAYLDSNYNPPMDFDGLMDKILRDYPET